MKQLLFISLIFFGIGCDAAPTGPGAIQKTPSKSGVGTAVRIENKPTPEVEREDVQLNRTDETVAVPSSVTGALLHCEIAEDSVLLGPGLHVGCRLENKEGIRIPLETVAEESLFSYKAPEGLESGIAVKLFGSDAHYDAAYTFKGKDIAESAALATTTELQIAFHNLHSGEADRGIILSLTPSADSSHYVQREF